MEHLKLLDETDENGMTTLRKDLEIPHNTTYALVWPSISIPWCLSEGNENTCSPKDLYENVHSSYMFIRAPD